ncbi:tetratricopeptide repeat protein [Ferruginibacter sp.]
MICTGAKKYIVAVICCCLILIACSNPVQPVTKEEAIAFAKEIENSIKQGNGDLLDNAFDKKEFVKKMDLPNTEEGNGFAKGIISKPIALGSQLVAALSDQDNFQFIKYYEKAGRGHIVFRLYTNKDGSLNYHDYELVKTGGKCRLADAYIYVSGENLSETMMNIFNSLYGKVSGGKNISEDDKLADLNELKKVKELMQRGQNREAKEKYDKLPAYIKASKSVMLINVLICEDLSTDEYSAALAEFREKYPNEPNMSLLMIDGYFMQKDYVKMLAAVNALDSQINKDPLLDYHRYLSYDLLEDKEKSMACLKRLVTNMPDFQKGYIEYIVQDLKSGNKQQADSLIAIYRKKPKFKQEELDTVVKYYE